MTVSRPMCHPIRLGAKDRRVHGEWENIGMNRWCEAKAGRALKSRSEHSLQPIVIPPFTISRRGAGQRRLFFIHAVQRIVDFYPDILFHGEQYVQYAIVPRHDFNSPRSAFTLRDIFSPPPCIYHQPLTAMTRRRIRVMTYCTSSSRNPVAASSRQGTGPASSAS